MIENARWTVYTEDGVKDIPIIVLGNTVMNAGEITLRNGDFMELTYTTDLNPDPQTKHWEF